MLVPPEKLIKGIEYKQLQPEKYLLVCTRKWKKRKIKEILNSERIIDFDESDQMSYNYLRKFNLLEFSQPERLFVNRSDALLQLLVAGYGYGVLTKEFSRKYLESGELVALNSGKSFDNNLMLAWYHRPEPPKYFSSIISIIS